MKTAEMPSAVISRPTRIGAMAEAARSQQVAAPVADLVLLLVDRPGAGDAGQRARRLGEAAPLTGVDHDSDGHRSSSGGSYVARCIVQENARQVKEAL
jgi:hypothetical protein